MLTAVLVGLVLALAIDNVATSVTVFRGGNRNQQNKTIRQFLTNYICIQCTHDVTYYNFTCKKMKLLFSFFLRLAEHEDR